ncbi:MAG TPA: hypothetical protein VMD75_01935 [Candidatus Binataceae bacterium]|nr:hypothetical protein [Candidatus Binataceae bacterium]
MTARIDAPLLMVGSVPLSNEDEVFEKCGRLLGDAVFALPDGETGERAIWITYEANHLFRPHPDIETLYQPTTPDGRKLQYPTHMFNFWILRVREGVKEIRFESSPRIQAAIDSYRKFAQYKQKGKIPSRVRFQVCLPLTESAIGMWFRPQFAHDWPILARAYEEVMGRELKRLFEAIPAEELALQWDICVEVLDLERLLQWTPKQGAWERFIEPVKRLSPSVPENVLIGYHLCYGTLGGWPMKEATDMALSVKMANAIAKEAGRRVDYFQMAGPRPNRSEEAEFYQPLQNLDIGEARVFLGLIHDLDGADGLRMRVKRARSYLPDFGISAACGFGRRPGEEMEATIKTHRDDVDAFLTELDRA